jgi:hypothetical protein
VASQQGHVEIDGVARAPSVHELVRHIGLDRQPIIAAMRTKEIFTLIERRVRRLASR